MLTFLFSFSTLHLFGEGIKGKIVDSKTKEALPFVQILVKGTYIGVVTNVDGEFKLEIPSLPAELVVRYLGYNSMTYNVTSYKQDIQIVLEQENINLETVLVVPNKSYDKILLRKIIKNRKKNNPDNRRNVSFRDYSRTSVFLNNINKESISNSKIFKNQVDAMISISDSTVMMPFFLEENITDCYRHKKGEKDSLHVILSQNNAVMTEVKDQIKGVLNKRLTSDVNFYKSQIVVFQRGFPSPISKLSSLYYNTYLTDSISDGEYKQYKFKFFPKSKKNITFSGYFWVDSETWSLTEVHAELPNEANINFVNNFSVSVNYAKDAQGKWFYNQQKVKLDLSIFKKKDELDGKPLLVQKVNTYRVLDQRKQGVSTHLVATGRQDSILQSVRIYAPMDSMEQKAEVGINKLKNNVLLKNIDRFGAMTLNGYYNLNKIDIGPYFAFYSTNEIEGSKVTLPLRTSAKMFDNFTVGGYLGYGFKSKAFDYGANIGYQFRSPKRAIISSKYHYDYFDLTRNKFMEFIQENPYQKGGGNIISSYTSFEPNPYVMKNQHLDLAFEYEVSKSLGFMWRGSVNRNYSNLNVPFVSDGKSLPYFDTQSILFDTRFSFDQDYDELFFSRIYYGNEKPIIHVGMLLGHYNINNLDVPKSGYYAQLNISFKNRVNIGPTFLKTLIEFGGIIGDVPYPVLNMTKGSRDLGSARYHYNLLHHTSYISDIYLNTHLAYNTGGILFNKIPLIKNLNLREMFTFKAYYGKLTGNHNSVMEIPSFFTTSSNVPYMETSVGVTNIFKCLRVEYVYRINKDKSFDSFSDRSGIRCRIEVTF
ncbi:DUF5686 and carboxypeptidase regulatory-like domain-containing protein [Halosquirtibacter laminarini]|uniref:DUF5686 and carboxypeptidase regulatory-like domain-containing protein n=1 Tax=Halosquirtibacter laminarini TaxID=3374600 RepID=A0AC61NFT0_9BACT|nr:DUF5686 and carboxypeptidase regulatory-like domain-containing protein [Prolixibacteraceae bacterium]